MRWFAAHIVMMVEIKNRKQDHFPVWENIVLIEAASEDDAFAAAKERGRADEGDDDGAFRWGRSPATWVFVGVRKLTECALLAERPESEDEVSFLELEFKTKNLVKRFVEGKSAVAVLNEKYRPSNSHLAELKRTGIGANGVRKKGA